LHNIYTTYQHIRTNLLEPIGTQQLWVVRTYPPTTIHKITDIADSACCDNYCDGL